MCNNLDASIESLLAPDFPWGVLNPPSMVSPTLMRAGSRAQPWQHV